MSPKQPKLEQIYYDNVGQKNELKSLQFLHLASKKQQEYFSWPTGWEEWFWFLNSSPLITMSR